MLDDLAEIVLLLLSQRRLGDCLILQENCGEYCIQLCCASGGEVLLVGEVILTDDHTALVESDPNIARDRNVSHEVVH